LPNSKELKMSIYLLMRGGKFVRRSFERLTIDDLLKIDFSDATYVSFFNCGIKEIPEGLFPIVGPLKVLDLSNNKLTKLPKLPNGLKELRVCNNKITEILELPPTLLNLFCSGNKLTCLPPLPLTLGELGCSRNPIESLPVIPASVFSLDCRNCMLKELPVVGDKIIMFTY